MDDNEITELAKGMVPFVRDCVAEASPGRSAARARRADRERGAAAA